jgi:hypothetical protein
MTPKIELKPKELKRKLNYRKKMNPNILKKKPF